MKDASEAIQSWSIIRDYSRDPLKLVSTIQTTDKNNKAKISVRS